MFDRFSVKNFKIHQDDTEIHFDGLTVFTGTNNSGKTSFIQSLQAFSCVNEMMAREPYLPLDQVEGLGDLKDVLNKNVGRSESIVYEIRLLVPEVSFCDVILEFGSVLTVAGQNIPMLSDLAVLKRFTVTIEYGEEEVKRYVFELAPQAERGFYQLIELSDEGEQPVCRIELRNFIPLASLSELEPGAAREALLRCLFVLSSIDRRKIRYLGPYRMIAKNTSNRGQNLLDASGSNAPEIIAKMQDQVIFDGAARFGEAFSYWSGKILDTEFQVKMESDQYRIGAVENGLFFDLNQIGFGNMQVVPVIVHVLAAKPGDLVIIENPEVHLHPKWKAALVELFYYAAEHGVRILIETQSVEIINRIRLTVKRNPKLKEKTALYFFEKMGLACEINRIDIEETGKLSVWPENFLDRVTVDDGFGLV